jgi:hypothetical protein
MMNDENITAILERQNKPATPEAIAAWRTQMDAMCFALIVSCSAVSVNVCTYIAHPDQSQSVPRGSARVAKP